MKKILMLGMLLCGPNWAFAVNNGQDSAIIPPVVLVSSFGLSGTLVSVTVSTPVAKSAYSAGEYNYITNIHIEAFYGGGIGGVPGTSFQCTTTNLPGSPSFRFPPMITTGTVTTVDMQFANPLRATQASQVTVVCPGSPTSLLWNIIVAYFQSN
jgi:hypothetical protein